MNFNIPDKQTYSTKIKELSDLFRSIVKTGSTAIGSGVYELLLRPMCIMYTSIEDYIRKWYNDYTLQELEKSNNTEIGVADAILSNYFISRKSGTESSAVVTIYTTEKSLRIDNGSSFEVDGITLKAAVTTYGDYSPIPPTNMSDGSVYVKSYKSGDYYCFPVSVVSDGITNAIVSEGAECTVISYLPSVVRVVLSSALTGGSGPETDAEMVARARNTVLSWIGSSASIHKILSSSGIPVYSSASFDFKDPELRRASSDNMYVNTGSMIDTYVKTSNYPLSGTTEVTLDRINANKYCADISSKIPAAVLSIKNVRTQEGTSVDYTVSWGSSDQSIDASAARLSVYQTTKITANIESDDDTVNVIVTYSYIPHIRELQTYINNCDNKILGWDVLIKAAVPVILRINGSLHTTSNVSTSDVIDVITRRINTTDVGHYELNLSDIQSALVESCGVLLSSPVLITATDMQQDGSEVVSSSASGVLQLSEDTGFSARYKFLCIETSGVSIE